VIGEQQIDGQDASEREREGGGREREKGMDEGSVVEAIYYFT
jgi:hypothetical protein